MKILHASFECYPLAKVGGLADVVGSLPKFQNEISATSKVIMPYYNNDFFKNRSKTVDLYTGTIKIDKLSYEYSIKELKSNEINFDVLIVYIEDLLDRDNVYGYGDEVIQYIAFQLSILNWLVNENIDFDIIHCHDHHTSLIPFFVKYCYEFQKLKNIHTVLTIHNAQYQGIFPHNRIDLLPEFNQENIGILDWYNSINPLATGIKCASRVTTVSSTYLEELKEKANGLEGLLRSEEGKCKGILNGIDTSVWNPYTDVMIIKNYKISNVISGKKANKQKLCNTYAFDKDLPLFGFIGRLVGEKAADLLPKAIEQALDENRINILILGSGHKEIEDQLIELKEKYKGRFSAYIGYDEKLSRLIYAGVDFLLMPSRVEPCGLNQMYALRYGTIPIVRRTGGLKDTVIDIGDGGFGICHDQASVWDICYSIKRAITFYNDKKFFRSIQKRIMKIDNSWNTSAKKYIEVYKSIQ